MLGFTEPLPTKGESPMVLQGKATRLEIVNNPLREASYSGNCANSIPNDYFVICGWIFLEHTS